ncbi:hypothetical protein E2L06_03355 [Haloterrigena sp. H1]|uniref:hypothetical protein n=1 Tax=Haloterrigena sp. H1 TaxID=2552943 RepID=UPI00110DA41F|nr:hypothetical protein [Haloterrigena sp. H1]TMT85680.1 hypothetical protein E2L06_03355 [Haloterrigena sp. H1]
MTLDRKTADRRRFARLLGTDGDRGSGLPVIGTDTDSEAADEDDDRDSATDATSDRRTRS